MKSIACFCVVLLGALCLASCGDEVTPVNPSQDTELEDAVATPPAQSGPYVIRYEDQTWVWIWDVEESMYAIVGIDIWDACTVGAEPEVIYIQDVVERNAQEAVNQIFHGENMSVSVWPVQSLDCEVLMNTPPIATGYVDMRGTDNDYFAWLHEDPKRMNSFGVMGHGTVEMYNGNSGQLSFHWRQCWRQGEGVYQYHEQITIGTKNPNH